MTEEMNLTNAELVKAGDIAEGTVIKVEDKFALIDIGSKQDAYLPINEISSLYLEKAGDALTEGEKISVKVLSHSEDTLLVSKKAVDNEKSWDDLQQKFDSGEAFDVIVHEAVKGGLVADIGVRGFIPASMVEKHFVEDFSSYKGQTLSVKVVEIDREKNRVILSHRAVAEEAQDQRKRELLEKLAPGQVIEGTVQRLTDFGAFVDVGGVDGLVHISQLSHQRVSAPSDILSEGDKVKVKVLGVDRDNDRISLSIKETQEGPWEAAVDQVKPGALIEGAVRRLVTFGAFIEVAPGVEGLVHISEISSRHIGSPSEVLKEGQKVMVKVLDVNSSEKRISLSIKAVQDEKDKENLKQNLPKEEKGFSLADMIGDKLKEYKN